MVWNAMVNPLLAPLVCIPPLRALNHAPNLKQMTIDCAGTGSVWSPTRGRISLSAFLYLAMVCFVSPKEPPESPRQQLQQPSPPQKESMSAEGPGGRRLYVRNRSGGGTGNNPCATTTTTTDCDGSVAAVSPPSTPTPRVWDTLRGSPGAAETREGGIVSPASVSIFPAELGREVFFHAAAGNTYCSE